MVKKRRPINVADEWRALLTDTMPFEVPVIVTNRLLHAHLLKRNIHILDLDFQKRSINNIKLTFSKGTALWTQPLEYHIERPNRDPRMLHYPHPISQLHVCLFYNKYKDLVIRSCAVSRFSLRKPARVATRAVSKEDAVSNEKSSIRQHGEYSESSDINQSLHLRSFYVYETTTFYPKFFKSNELIELESKYSRMLELDITNCFGSIYTHSLEWATRGKMIAKSRVGDRTKPKMFEDLYDGLMASMNWGETNGILVGPECSRLFAEVLLTAIDRRVWKTLSDTVEIPSKVTTEFRFKVTT